MSESLTVAAERRIFKYPIEITDFQTVRMPDGARLLDVQEQAGLLCLWALVDPNRPEKARIIEVFGTGNPIDVGPRDYVGTAQVGPFVWHVFERFTP